MDIPEILDLKIIDPGPECQALRFVLLWHLYNTLRRFMGSVPKTADLLDINERTVYRKMDLAGIEIDRKSRLVSWPATERLRIANED